VWYQVSVEGWTGMGEEGRSDRNLYSVGTRNGLSVVANAASPSGFRLTLALTRTLC
jgi:hypothetical protein